jgi:hypothetical protein
MVARQHLAQAADDVGITMEIVKHSCQLSVFSQEGAWHFARINSCTFKDLPSLAESGGPIADRQMLS